MDFDTLSSRVIGCALKVHQELGPGLLESTYEQCLAYELSQERISFELQKTLPVMYKGVKIDCGYRIDLLVENSLILELKAVDEINPVHQAQILTYLRLSGVKTGLLINFNVKRLDKGIKRFVM